MTQVHELCYNKECFCQSKNDEYTIQADYALPLNEKIKLEAGAKAILRDITSNSLVQVANGTGVYIENDLMSMGGSSSSISTSLT